jgi:hypothetical protein
MQLSGSSPQGEEDTERACQVLADHLNGDGARWVVKRGAEPADCDLVDAGDPRTKLSVQLVRAIVSSSLWRELNTQKTASRVLAPKEAISEIRAAIQSKADDARIPTALRSTLILALDATRLPGLAFDAIVQEFRASSMTWAASHGFLAVWLVGPIPRLVSRLDAVEQEP